MKNLLLLLILSIIVTISINAQYQGPIPEITQGYGTFGTYANDTLITIENTTVPSNVLADRTVSIFYSKSITLPAPTVMIAPGWGQFSPTIFEHLIDFIVSKACVVVYAPTQSNGGSWFENHYSGMQMAIDSFPNIIDTTQIGLFGHSVGAGAVAWLGKKFFMDKNYGLNGRFMFASSAWINFNITQNDLVNFPEDVAFIMQYFEEDTGFVSPNGTDPRYGIDIYNNINIPASEKDFIMVKSSDVSGYHYNTEHGIYSNAPYDALDFYGLFRHVDALIDYKFNGNCVAKYTCLGNGGPKQIDMGQMTDLDVNANIQLLPPSHYDYPCNSSSNPRAAYCTDSLFAEPFIDYIDSVLINESSCSILDTGIVITSYTNQHFCDSFVIRNIVLNPSNDTILYDETCEINDYGTFVDTLYNSFGCDSIVTTIISLLPTNDTFISIPVYNILDTGTVVEVYTNQHGCDSIFTITSNFIDTTTGVQNLAIDFLSIENPIKDYIHIKSQKKIFKVEIINSNGQLIKTFLNNFENLSINDVEKSIYFLKIHFNKSVYFRKILVN